VTPLPLDAFLGLPWSDRMRATLRDRASRDDVLALSATGAGGKLTAQVWTELPEEWPPGTSSVYCKHELPQPDDVTKSRTMQAVELVQQGMTVYAAAKQIGVSRSAVFRALATREDKTVCPCCGQIVREGFQLDPEKLKA